MCYFDKVGNIQDQEKVPKKQTKNCLQFYAKSLRRHLKMKIYY